MSTGSEPFSLLISLDATIFVLPTSVLILIETICPKICSKSRLKSAKSPLSVDVRRSKTSLFKHPIFRRAPFLPTRLTALRSPRMCMTTTWKYLISRHSFVEDVSTRQRLFLFSRTSGQSFRIQLYKNLPTFDELNEMEWGRESLKQRELTFFKWPFVAVVFLLLLFRPQTRNAVVRRILYDTMKS